MLSVKKANNKVSIKTNEKKIWLNLILNERLKEIFFIENVNNRIASMKILINHTDTAPLIPVSEIANNIAKINIGNSNN